MWEAVDEGSDSYWTSGETRNNLLSAADINSSMLIVWQQNPRLKAFRNRLSIRAISPFDNCPAKVVAVIRDVSNLFKLGEILAVLDPHGVLAPVPVSLLVVTQRDPASADLLQSLIGSDVAQLHEHLLREQLVPGTGTVQTTTKSLSNSHQLLTSIVKPQRRRHWQ